VLIVLEQGDQSDPFFLMAEDWFTQVSKLLLKSLSFASFVMPCYLAIYPLSNYDKFIGKLEKITIQVLNRVEL
jgi:hypothetical protein